MIRLRTLLAGALILCLTSCLTIEEHYTFKKNGSGTMTYVVDLSELGELMKGLEALSDEKKGSDESLDMMDLKENIAQLKAIPGLSKVKLDQKEWVQRISFHFKDITALNAALNVLLPDSSGTGHGFFAWEGNTLVRTNNRHAAELGEGLNEVEESDSTDGEGIDTQALLGTMKYKYSFTFSEPVAGVQVAEGVSTTQEKPKKVDIATDWSVITADPKALDLRITLDK